MRRVDADKIDIFDLYLKNAGCYGDVPVVSPVCKLCYIV